LSQGGTDWNRFSVTYDDLHGLFGGLTLTIHGNGKVEQQSVRVVAREPRNASNVDLQKLVDLLLNQKAWEQRVAERPPRPDEGKVRLIINYREDSMTIWEWYNDLLRNNRILRIRDFMQAIAWK
jgi:hypothetical protein